MIKQMAWNTFKNTGSIDSYLEFIQLEDIEKNKKNEEAIKAEKYENVQNKGDYNIGK